MPKQKKAANEAAPMKVQRDSIAPAARNEGQLLHHVDTLVGIGRAAAGMVRVAVARQGRDGWCEADVPAAALATYHVFRRALLRVGYVYTYDFGGARRHRQQVWEDEVAYATRRGLPRAVVARIDAAEQHEAASTAKYDWSRASIVPPTSGGTRYDWHGMPTDAPRGSGGKYDWHAPRAPEGGAL